MFNETVVSNNFIISSTNIITFITYSKKSNNHKAKVQRSTIIILHNGKKTTMI